MYGKEQAEKDLVEQLADSLCEAVEYLDAQTIIKCIKVALSDLQGYHENELAKLKEINDSIPLP